MIIIQLIQLKVLYLTKTLCSVFYYLFIYCIYVVIYAIIIILLIFVIRWFKLIKKTKEPHTSKG